MVWSDTHSNNKHATACGQLHRVIHGQLHETVVSWRAFDQTIGIFCMVGRMHVYRDDRPLASVGVRVSGRGGYGWPPPRRSRIVSTLAVNAIRLKPKLTIRRIGRLDASIFL